MELKAASTGVFVNNLSGGHKEARLSYGYTH